MPNKLVDPGGANDDDVDDAETWVDAVVSSQVESLVGCAEQGPNVTREGRRFVDQREDGAIVERVAMQVTQ